MIPVWPSSLPQTPRRRTWDGGPMDMRRRFQPDGGEAVLRAGATAEVMSYPGVVFPNLTAAQLATFRSFLATDLRRGSLPFAWLDPVTHEVRLWRLDGDGSMLYRVMSKGGDRHDLTVNLICRPGVPWWSAYTPALRSEVPTLVMDFLADVHGSAGDRKALSSILTLTRSSTAARVAPSGLIEVVAANVARLDFDPVTLSARGLLLEEARTNVCLRSEDLTAAPWAATLAVITANAGTAPDGAVTADKMVANSGAVAGAGGVFQSVAMGAAQAVAASIYVKTAGHAAARLTLQALTAADADLGTATLRADLASGAVLGTSATGLTALTYSIEPAGGGWFRLIVAGTTPATTAKVRIGLRNDVTGNATDGMLAWGAQVEAGVLATSYVATAAASVTRAADVALVTGPAFTAWGRSIAGTLLREVMLDHGLTGAAAPVHQTALTGATAADAIALRLTRDPTAPFADATVTVGGSPVLDSTNQGLTGPQIAAPLRQAVAWAASDLAAAVAGSIAGPFAPAQSPALSRLVLLGDPATGAAQGRAHLRSLRVFADRLPDAVVQGLTT